VSTFFVAPGFAAESYSVITTRPANGSFRRQVFDEVTGTSRKWFTLTGNTLNGTYHPIPADGSEQVGFFSSYTSDASGNILRPTLSFDGSNDSVDCGNSAVLNLTTALTIEAEVYFPASAVKELIVKNNNSNSGPGTYEVYQNGQKISFRLYKSGSPNTLTSNTSVSTSTWTPIAAVWDGSTMKIYINGQLDSNTLSLTGPIDTTTGKLTFAAYANGNYPFQGYLRNIRIWSYARSQTEIQRDMCKPLRGDEHGLVGFCLLTKGLAALSTTTQAMG